MRSTYLPALKNVFFFHLTEQAQTNPSARNTESYVPRRPCRGADASAAAFFSSRSWLPSPGAFINIVGTEGKGIPTLTYQHSMSHLVSASVQQGWSEARCNRRTARGEPLVEPKDGDRRSSNSSWKYQGNMTCISKSLGKFSRQKSNGLALSMQRARLVTETTKRGAGRGANHRLLTKPFSAGCL